MQIPKDPQRGMPIKDDFLALKRFMLASRIVGVEGGSIRETPNGSVIRIDNKPENKRNTLPPFSVMLNRNEEGWTASVTPGVVCERVTTDADAIILHEPVGITSEGEPVAHAVGDGQSIAVKVSVLETGAIGLDGGDAVEVVVISTGEASTHYIPQPVGNQAEGAVGIYYYVLADFVADGDFIVKQSKREGSHIGHWRDLPMFESVGGYVDVFKEYTQSDGKYKVRTIKGTNGIDVEQDGDTINVKGGGLWGTVTWDFIDNNNTSVHANLSMTFEAGIWKSVMGTGVTASGAGTEDDPLDITFNSYDN